MRKKFELGLAITGAGMVSAAAFSMGVTNGLLITGVILIVTAFLMRVAAE